MKFEHTSGGFTLPGESGQENLRWNWQNGARM